MHIWDNGKVPTVNATSAGVHAHGPQHVCAVRSMPELSTEALMPLYSGLANS